MKTNPMIKLFLGFLVASAVLAQVARAQNRPGEPATVPQLPSVPAGRALAAQPAPGGGGPEQSPWHKFDLNFPGGSPRELVSAIEKGTGKHLNVLISKEDEAVELPPMKFKAVTIPDVFSALRMASQKLERSGLGPTFYTQSYDFETQGHGEDAIFYFKCTKPPPPQELCRFYQLSEDLKNYSIEDITTAIQTGWKMLAVKSPPQLKFHPETKLLIAVGPPEELGMIDSVLKELRTAPQAPGSSRKKDGAVPPQ